MLKYLAIAAALKLFSATPATRQLYRALGNRLGTRWRLRRGLSPAYVDRACAIWALCRRYPLAPDGARILELGTGWLHWESICIRLLHDVQTTLYDVWDNRQFAALQKYCAGLYDWLQKESPLSSEERQRALGLLSRIAHTRSLEELYCLLGFQYVLEPSGTLQHFADASFDAVVSSNVLEHVQRDILPGYICDLARLLKPGGYSVHRIDVGDHLAYYDQGVPKKNYLRYSESVWRRWFENEVQYFNRVQRPGWLQLFSNAGLELLEEKAECTSLDGLPIAAQYAHLGPCDLACTVMWLVHRKPQPGDTRPRTLLAGRH